jgi:hypothetical protein
MSSSPPLISFNVLSADDTFNVEVISVKEPKAPATTTAIMGRLSDAHSQSPSRTTWMLHYNTATDQQQIDIVASGKLKSKITPTTRQVIAESVMMRYKNGLLEGSQVRHLTPSPPFSF